MIKIISPCFIRVFVMGEWHDIDAKINDEFDETDADVDIDDLMEDEDYIFLDS